MFDANGNLLKSDQPNQAWTSASVNFSSQPTDRPTTFASRSPATNVFAMGGFQLRSVLDPPDLKNPTINQDKTTNATLQTATVLSYTAAAVPDSSYVGTMKDTSGSHFSQVTASQLAANANDAMLISVMSLQGGNSDPGIHVYDQQGNPQAFQVLTNDGLNYMVQLTDVAPGSTNYVELTQQSPNGKSNPGDYHLCVNFGLRGVDATPAVAGNVLNQAKQTDAGVLVMSQAALVHFALGTNAFGSSVPLNVTMTITDSTGKIILSLTSSTNQPRSR